MSNKTTHIILIFSLTISALFCSIHEIRSQSCDAQFESFTGNNPLIVTFQNRSTGVFTQSFWDFGDGTVSQDQNPLPHTYASGGLYFVTLTIGTTNGICDSVTKRICLKCVFPGDANNDGIVNNKDVLYVGISYGAVGPVRRDHQPDSPSPLTSWVTSTGVANVQGGPNIGHADCDGNGIIDRHDIRLIDQNYNQRSGKSAGSECLDVNDIPLYFEIHDSIPAGALASVAIKLGSLQIPAQKVYGIAYTVNYDNRLIQQGSVALNYGNSLLGTQQDLVFLNKDFFSDGKMETAVSRIDLHNISVSGTIGFINFVMEENLAQKTMLSEILNLSFSDVTLLMSDGTSVPVCAWMDSAVVYEKYLTSDGRNAKMNSEISIYPNPANGLLYFDLPHSEFYQIEIINMLGKKMITETAASGSWRMDVSHLSRGIYCATVLSGNTAQTFKIEISR